MPSWWDSHFALGFLVGCLLAVLLYVIDWWYHVKFRPKRADERAELKASKDNSLTGQLYAADRERHPEEYDPAPPSPSLTDTPTEREQPATAGIEEQGGLPTQEHPAPPPKTSMIDFRQPPPPPPPYTGPERRLRSDNPYPELRRRADDRERQEREAALRPTPPPAPERPRMTRAEERRLREGQATPSDPINTESE